MKSNISLKKLFASACFLPATLSAATVVNIDFGRDISSGGNPGTNVQHVLYTGVGPAPDTGTIWNDGKVPLAGTGDTIAQPVNYIDLNSSTGTATTIDVQLTSNFFRSFNGTTAPAANTVAALQNDRVFSNNNNLATLTIQGLNPTYTYNLYFINSVFNTNYTVGAVTKSATGTAYTDTWTEGAQYASFLSISPTEAGTISVGIQGNGQVSGAISGMQIVVVPEPSSAFLLLGTLLGLTFTRRR